MENQAVLNSHSEVSLSPADSALLASALEKPLAVTQE